ncbi:MAG: hypothetical protein NT031_09315 [Planctomycetota bacterium]|nr:hypothetical protein [Planctomycetota bacterium]
MSESVGRAYLPTGQSLPISRDNRQQRRSPGGKKPRPGAAEEGPEAPTPPAAAPGGEDIEETGHLDVLM